MCALWHHQGSARHKAGRPPRPLAHPPPCPDATVNSPRRPQATDATRTTGVPAPSGAGTPQSPRQERASKRAAQRHQPQHHAATALRVHRASPAGRGPVPSPKNRAAAGTRPEQPLSNVHPQTSPGRGRLGYPAPQPQTPPDASTRGPQPPARQVAATQAHPERRPHHGPPIWPTEGPTPAPSEGPPTETCTATPTDAVRPQAGNPTESTSPQAPATPSTSAPGCHPPAPAQAEPASEQHHDPPAWPAVQSTETPSSSCPARNPGPDPDPDPTRATDPAGTPRANEPGRELPAGIPHPKGGTQAAGPASA